MKLCKNEANFCDNFYSRKSFRRFFCAFFLNLVKFCMEIFLDAFDIEQIRKYRPFLRGITTNPLIISKSVDNQSDFYEKLQSILSTFPDLLINLQVTKPDADGMIAEAAKIAEFSPNMIVKIPLTFEGLKAIKEVSKMQIPINGTLCFSLIQAKMAEDSGVKYISPFLGRMEDSGEDIASFVDKLVKSVSGAKILAASIRTARHLEIVTQAKCAAFTCSQSVLDNIFDNNLLVGGLVSFQEANKFSFL